MFVNRDTLKEIGSAVRERRAATGLSQAAVAKSARIGRSTLIHFEQGRKDVRLSNVLAIASAIGASFGLRPASPEQAERVLLRSEEATKLMRRRHAHARIALDLALRKPAALRALAEARAMVALWRKHRTCSEQYIAAWSQILRGRPQQVAARLRDMDPAWIDALLQNTPFPNLAAPQ